MARAEILCGGISSPWLARRAVERVLQLRAHALRIDLRLRVAREIHRVHEHRWIHASTVLREHARNRAINREELAQVHAAVSHRPSISRILCMPNFAMTRVLLVNVNRRAEPSATDGSPGRICTGVHGVKIRKSLLLDDGATRAPMTLPRSSVRASRSLAETDSNMRGRRESAEWPSREDGARGQRDKSRLVRVKPRRCYRVIDATRRTKTIHRDRRARGAHVVRVWRGRLRAVAHAVRDEPGRRNRAVFRYR